MNAVVQPTAVVNQDCVVGGAPAGRRGLRDRKAQVWARADLEWYVEPERCAAQLFAVEGFVGPIWDPSCGSGNILRAAEKRGLQAGGSDLVGRVGDDIRHLFFGTFDFRTASRNPPCAPRPLWHATNIVTNPPFFRAKGTEEWARRALTIATGKVAIFASLPFLAGQARGKGLWADHPPTRVWIHSERPSCPPGEWLAEGNTAKGGTEDWCWLVWDLTAPRGMTQLGWLHGDGGAACAQP